MEAKLVYTVAEAAKLLGVSRGLAYRMARERLIPVLRLGGKRLVIPKAALDRLLESGGRTPVS